MQGLEKRKSERVSIFLWNGPKFVLRKWKSLIIWLFGGMTVWL